MKERESQKKGIFRNRATTRKTKQKATQNK